VRLAAFGRSIRRRGRALVCREAVKLMTEYLEGALGAAERRQYEAHLAGCIACNTHLSQMRATVAILGEVEPDELPDAVVEELVQLYRRVPAP
jgi:anti-sigma factor RsiW